jgi:pimeloyl-ACP methyl ester carboxylesterase
MSAPDISTQFVSANGLTFEVDMCGSGDRLALMLHGFPESKFSWRFQLPLLARLGYKAWAPNLRGYGRSSRPSSVSDYHIEKLAGDVAGLIDAAKAKEVVLIAHDWGAVIAWYFAIKKIRPLSRLIIMNVPHPLCMQRELRKWAQLKKSWYIFFFQIPWLPERLLTARRAEAIGKAFTDMAVDKSRFPESVVNAYRQNALLPGAMRAMINYYRAAVRAGTNVMVPKDCSVDTPTLMIWGENDTALGKETTFGTEAHVKDFTIRYLPGVSHWVQQEAPEKVNAMIEAWLAGQPVPIEGDVL